MTVPLTEYTLLPADLSYLRTVLIRDDFQEHTNPITAISRYNQDERRQFVSDTTLQLMLNEIINDQRALIEGSWTNKKSDQILLGDEIADAETASDVYQTNVMLYLLAIAVFEMMLRDLGYLKSLGDTPGEYVDQMEAQIDKWLAIAGSASSEWGFVDLYRY